MAVHEIMEDFFFVERGFLNANHFVLCGDKPVLVDTAYKKDFHETRALVQDLGIDLRDVSRIISTHSHCDHIGGNRLIQEMSGCTVEMHRIGRHFMVTRDDWATWWRYFVQEADFFDCKVELNDGDIVRVGPHEFLVIYTPGHASDGIVLYNRAEKVLLSSDTLWKDDMAVMAVRVEGSRAPFEMLASLDRIADLDVRTVYPGHGRPFHDFHDALERTRRRLRGFLEKPSKMGNDILKKITVYTLMMKEQVDSETFFDYLMTTPWFRETVDLYFRGDYDHKYREVMDNLTRRGIVRIEDGVMRTTVKP